MIRVEHGDSREVLPTMAEASVDACVCDPPYSLVSIQKRFGKPGQAPAAEGVYRRSAAGFMGKQWDTGETAFDPAFWTEVLRVLKPGAHLIAFGGTRTYHRLACAIEDAGFEIRDQIGWCFGSGFPKSHNAGNGWGTALKPAWEPIVLARKPIHGTVAANVLAHGVGVINIDGCRVNSGASPSVDRRATGKAPTSCKPGEYGDGHAIQNRITPERWLEERPGESLGRWPANLIHDGSDEVLAVFPSSEVGNPNRIGGGSGGIWNDGDGAPAGPSYADHGSAARFFYSAKADAGDRLQSKHPTVKPVDLMAYLCRLVTPPGGLVLDPFAGSGTTGMACMREGFDAILIEREAEYVADIHRRLAHVHGEDTPLFQAAE